MYQLHIANKNYSSWSLRPWLLMRVLGIPFEEKLSVFGEGSNFEKFREFSPNGRVPCLVDDGFAVWDSLAIIEYLAERHQGVWPEDAKARAWARSASAEMHSGFSDLRNICGMNCGIQVELTVLPPGLLRDIARVGELWGEGLQKFGGPYLAGDRFTAVDAYFAPVVFRALSYGLDLGPVANLYAERIRALPAMKEWYEAALAEPWRDHGHEAEVAAVGTVTQDLRVTA